MFKVIENKDGTYQSVFPPTFTEHSSTHDTVDAAVSYIRCFQKDAEITVPGGKKSKVKTYHFEAAIKGYHDMFFLAEDRKAAKRLAQASLDALITNHLAGELDSISWALNEKADKPKVKGVVTCQSDGTWTLDVGTVSWNFKTIHDAMQFAKRETNLKSIKVML